MSNFLGLGKTMYNSNVALLREEQGEFDIEIILTERLNRIKNAGNWPELALNKFSNIQIDEIAENRDISTPLFNERLINEQFPFFEYLKKSKLDKFTKNFNKDIRFVGHHQAHANAAALMSPWENALILVMDGAGSRDLDLSPEILSKFPSPDAGNSYEEASIFKLDYKDDVILTPLRKRWQVFKKGKIANKKFSDGVGSLYEKAAEYIFGNNMASGKVMGLAGFGEAEDIIDYRDYLNSLDWEKAFKKGSKAEWELSPHLVHYKNIAASVQKAYEKNLLNLLKELKDLYPEHKNLILMGGCALNCTANMKIIQQGLYKNVYVPPFPGDGSIGLGSALELYFSGKKKRASEKRTIYKHGYFGPKSSIPTQGEIEKEFFEFNIKKSSNIEADTADLLKDGHIIAWFQGRSESGPRALGNRSILSRVDRKELKLYLNKNIKFREEFRPYGCSVAFEKAQTYFDIPDNFENPFMSFTCPIREEYKDFLKEVSHVDDTSRMQTVKKEQNERYYRLLEEYGKRSGQPVLLNTSLNIMGEPILESIGDARKFFIQSEVKYLVINEFIIEKK